jgi:O-antigen/teichoic acid export membrane protein
MNNIFGTQILITIGGSRYFLGSIGLSAIVAMLLSSILCYFAGASGAAIGVLVGEIVLCSLYYACSVKVSNINWMFNGE